MDQEQVRTIVREEIVAALRAFAREAEHYDGGEIRDMAVDALSTVLDGTVTRLTCKHEKYSTWYNTPQCARCGEPEPEPVNPFEGPDHEHTHDVSEGAPTDCIECGAPYRTKES
jgi:hypothetical protein